MSSYILKLELLRDEFNTIKTDTNYFELNARAKQIVDDMISLVEENMVVLQTLASDMLSVQPDATYYTKEAIDARIEALNNAKVLMQLKLLHNAKDIGNFSVQIEKILVRVDEQVEEFSSFRKSVLSEIGLIKKQIKDDSIVSSQSYFALTEFIRNTMNSWVVSVKQRDSFPYDIDDHAIDNRGSQLEHHNHVNCKNMSGMGEIVYNADGDIFQDRHSDHRWYQKGTAPMEIVPMETPQVSNYHFGVENMQDLFDRFNKGLLIEEEKELFVPHLFYTEAWWQEVEFLDERITDTYPSFRHQYGNQSPAKIAYMANNIRDTGIKARFENVPYSPITKKIVNEDGTTKYAIKMYRVLCHPITSLRGKKWSDFLVQKHDRVDDVHFGDIDYLSSRARFEFRSMNTLDEIIENIPGMGGHSEEILDYKTTDGYTVKTPVDMANYRRKYKLLKRDAMGVVSYVNTWKDPVAYKAMTNTEGIVGGVSELIPLYIGYGTPLANWNPNDLEEVASVTGSGTEASPYNGINENGFFYTTPAAFYEGFENVTPADTGTGVKAIRNIHGDVTLNAGAGVYINLPKIANVDERVRIRFPIHFTADEFSPANIRLEAYTKQQKKTNAMLMRASIQQSVKIGSIKN